MSDADNQAVVETPGAALAAARQAQNLSVVDAARQLKLSVSQIEALEAGNFEKLPGTIFVRGFIRNYARMLKLDADALLRSVDLTLPAPSAREEVPPSQNIPFPAAQPKRSPWYALILVLLLGGLVAFDYFWNEPTTLVSKTDTLPATTVQKIEPPAPVEAMHNGSAKTTEVPVAVTGDSAPAAAPDIKTAGSPVVADVPSVAQVSASEVSRQPQPGERPLRFVFKEESWVEIRDSYGKIIFSQLNSAGSEKRIYGAPPMSVVIGNAHGVQLTYNGQPIDLGRHTTVDVARFTLE